MGMDVDGLNPTNAAGEYFRANMWGWSALWGFATDVSPLPATVEYGWTNDGDGLKTAEECNLLADHLEAAIKDGRLEQMNKEYEAWCNSTDSWTGICEWCKGTGVRTDEVGKRYRMDVEGKCNGCNPEAKPQTEKPELYLVPNRWPGEGEPDKVYRTYWPGHRRSYSASDDGIRLPQEFLESFITFLRNCGGFAIY